MLESLPVTVVIGTVLGFLSGLGIGGGSLLILWLTIVLGTDPQTARSINLLFFLPSAVIACILRRKHGMPAFSKLLPAIAGGTTAAAVVTWLASQTSPDVLRKPFGFLLLLTALRELFYRRKNPK
jgi:uncharacterized membrane protein YfcA